MQNHISFITTGLFQKAAALFTRKLAAFYCVVLLLPALPAGAQRATTKGTEFWLGFMENLSLSLNGAPRFSIIVSADVTTNIRVSMPLVGYNQLYSVQGGQATEILLPNAILYPEGSESVADKGILVTSESPVTLWAQHHRVCFSDETIVLPITELSDSYMTMNYASYTGNEETEFIIVAPQDNTVVDIVPSTYTKSGRSPGAGFSVTLQRGQVYQVQAFGELTGTSIKAKGGKKIAVFSGAKTSTVKCPANNHLYDQLFPLNYWGSDYVLVPFKIGFADVFRFIAENDGTSIYFNCNKVLLSKGQYFDTLISTPTHVISSGHVSVGQFKTGDCGSVGDGTFMMCLPLSFSTTKSMFYTYSNAAPGMPFSVHQVNVVTRSANAQHVMLDNVPLVFTPVPSSPEYSYAQLDVTEGNHTLLSDSAFCATVSGHGFCDGYSATLGFDTGVSARPPQGSLSIHSPDSLCTDIAGDFSGTSPTPVSSWQWSFGDYGTASGQTAPHIFTTPGMHIVTLVATGNNSSCPVIAEELFHVSNCSAECDIFVPKAFSPNKDGINDLLCVYGPCISEMEFKIYNRWGEVVFKTGNLDECWDGLFKNEQVNNAAFAWSLQATLFSGKKVIKKGNVTSVD